MSWNGTVRCGNCYESGHNKTGCPELKKAWEKDPNSYDGREWARIVARKAQPKTCSYCDGKGHTRAGCATMKEHKIQYHADAVLFRKAIAAWMRETGLAVGALVRAQDAQYYTQDGYSYPGNDDYVPPVGLVMNVTPSVHHYTGISGSSEWMNADTFLTMDGVASAGVEDYRRSIGLSLPCVAGIVPRMGKDWYGSLQDRQDRSSNIKWEVVSAGYHHFDTTNWTSHTVVKATIKEHFSRDEGKRAAEFRTFEKEQREQMENYLNGSIDLSEMKDPELPDNDS